MKKAEKKLTPKEHLERVTPNRFKVSFIDGQLICQKCESGVSLGYPANLDSKSIRMFIDKHMDICWTAPVLDRR